jgi:electron transfer flavoprotein beta subunit
MNIVVCLKQVPGTTEVKIDPEKNTLIRQGIKAIVNPFDSYALEEGVRLKERLGGKVTAITMGPPQAADMLRDAIAVGADETVLLSDMAFAGSDTLATAAALGKAIEKIKSYDLIICGRQTIDGDTGQVGPELAENLGIPFIAYVSKIEEVANGKIRVQRAVEDGYETIETSLPAVITVAKEINVPRMPSLRGLSKSKSAQIPTWTANDIAAEKDQIGQAGSGTWVVKVFYPQRIQHAEMIKGEPAEQAKALIEKLKEAKII